MKKFLLSIILLFSLMLSGCTIDVEIPGKDDPVPLPNKYTDTASTDGLMFKTDSLHYGLFKLNLEDIHEDSLFEFEFSNIEYTSITGNLCYDITITDPDFDSALYKYEIYNVDSDYRRGNGSFGITEETTTVTKCTDSINSGELWTIKIGKYNYETNKALGIAGFMFQIPNYEERSEKLVTAGYDVEEIRNESVSGELELTIYIREAIEAVSKVTVTVTNVSNEDVQTIVVNKKDFVVNDNDMIVFTENIGEYHTQSNNAYLIQIFIDANDGYIHYENVLVRQVEYNLDD